MCTAICDDRLFGRTLDLEGSLGECVAVMPRGFSLTLSSGREATRYAVIGTALVRGEMPLFFDGVNEVGIAAAALNFPVSAEYLDRAEGTVASHELILLVLGFCRSLSEVRALLSRTEGICGREVDGYPPSPLHWMITDGKESLTVEATASGLLVYDNELGVLTNEPPFPYQRTRAADYMALDSTPPVNTLAPGADLPAYSRGMGAIGLPGDSSSSSRFVRALYAKEKTEPALGVERISRFFHVMDTVAQPKGFAKCDTGAPVYTVYTSAVDLDTGDYYYTTYASRAIRALALTERLASADELTLFPMTAREHITFET